MNIGWPEGIYLASIFVTLCAHLSFNGKSRGTYNPGIYLFNAAIAIWLLWWGGFFS